MVHEPPLWFLFRPVTSINHLFLFFLFSVCFCCVGVWLCYVLLSLAFILFLRQVCFCCKTQYVDKMIPKHSLVPLLSFCLCSVFAFFFSQLVPACSFFFCSAALSVTGYRFHDVLCEETASAAAAMAIFCVLRVQAWQGRMACTMQITMCTYIAGRTFFFVA